MAKTIGSDVIVDQIGDILRNPKAAVGVAFNLLEDLTDGAVVIVDPSNAYAYQLEMSVINTSYGLTQSEAMVRRIYSSMATSVEELYPHMADEDYLDRFYKPSSTIGAFVMPVNDIIGRAVPLNDGSGSRALVIPRHTSMTTGNYTFTLQYPIVIKVLFNGTLSIYMDTTQQSPLFLPTTNMLSWSKQRYDNQEWLLIDFPMQQVKITSTVIQAISFTGYSSTFNYTDYFCHARAYVRDSSNNWIEVVTTHQDQVYDPNVVTVCLQVLNGSVKAYIPQIYFQRGMVTGSVRLDIYTTLGPLNVDLTKDQISTFKVKFEDLNYGLTVFSEPLQRMSNISGMVRTEVTGGRIGRTFTELQRIVTQRSKFVEGLPITPDQINRRVGDAGFRLMTMLDSVRLKQYVATKELDPPGDLTTVTGLSCSVQNIGFKVSEFETNSDVYNTTKRVSVKPEMLFMYDHGGIRKLADSEVLDLKGIAAQNPDGIANVVNNSQYYFTPFHYIMDMTSYNFGVRPYIMTNPKVVSRYRLQSNDTLGIDITSNSYSVIYRNDGSCYTVYVQLTPNSATNAMTADMLSVQLSYTSGGDATRTTIAGTLVTPIDTDTGGPINGEWLYSFEIYSDFDINKNHEFDVTNTGIPIGLETEFDTVFIIKDYSLNSTVSSDIDRIVNKDKIPDYDYRSTYLGVSQEKVTIKFGEYMSHLWRRSNTVVSQRDYRRYEEDVYAYYTKDVYKLKPGTKVVDVQYDSTTGKVTTTKLHAVGDPVLDVDGKPTILHQKDSVMYDVKGDPVPIQSELELQRYIDILLVDGKYYFATNELSTTYYKEAVSQMSTWVSKDIVSLNSNLIGLTDVYYYPHTSTGLIDVIVGDGSMARVRADQTLSIVYTMRRDKFNNAEIKKNLDTKSAALFMDALNSIKQVGSEVITKSDIVSVMRTALKDDVVDIQIKGFLDDQYNSVIISDVSNMPTIGKRLVTLSNLTLQVQDSVSVDYEVLDKELLGPYTIAK